MKITGSNIRLKYCDFWFLGKKYIGCNLSLGQFFWGAAFLGAICPRVNYVDDKSSERQFSSGAFSSGILSEANYLWSNCPGANHTGGNFSRGQLSGHRTIYTQKWNSRNIMQVSIWYPFITYGVVFRMRIQYRNGRLLLLWIIIFLQSKV